MVGLMVWLVLVVLTVVVCIAVIWAIRKPMSVLLKANSYISPARSFYLRAFTVVVVLAALATVSETGAPESDKAFMEYVWWIVETLQPVLYMLSFWVMGYAALMTLLFMILGRYRD
jgi:hypothetical protein